MNTQLIKNLIGDMGLVIDSVLDQPVKTGETTLKMKKKHQVPRQQEIRRSIMSSPEKG